MNYFSLLYNMFFSYFSKNEDINNQIEMDFEKEVNEEEAPKKITGYNVTYVIPNDMKKMKVRLLEKNGTYKTEYTLTDYLDIESGERFQIIIER